MARFGLLLIICFLTGCGPAGSPESRTLESSMLVTIQSIIAEKLGLDPENVRPERTFTALGADDLDLVEITMEVEDRFGIAIKDEALANAAGARDISALCDKLTVGTFASVAENSPKLPQTSPSPEAADRTLQESQVGTFGELSHLPNPNGLSLVFIPSFEELTQIQEQQLGRKLDEAEIETLRQAAVVIALPQDIAEELKQQKLRGNGFGDHQ